MHKFTVFRAVNDYRLSTLLKMISKLGHLLQNREQKHADPEVNVKGFQGPSRFQIASSAGSLSKREKVRSEISSSSLRTVS